MVGYRKIAMLILFMVATVFTSLNEYQADVLKVLAAFAFSANAVEHLSPRVKAAAAYLKERTNGSKT